MNDKLAIVRTKTNNRKKALQASCRCKKFTKEYTKLIDCINEITSSIYEADELAKGVAGVQALLGRHEQHRGLVKDR